MSNPHITKAARGLMQMLTGTVTELVHLKDDGRWCVMRGMVESPLTGASIAAAREIIHLCLVETTLRRPGRTHYRITREGRKMLVDPDHVPAFLQARIRQ